MRRILFALLLALASRPALADTLIFHEGCQSSPQQTFPASTNIIVGTSWSAQVDLVGAPGGNTLSGGGTGSVQCLPTGGANDVGYTHVITPAPTTDAYYAEGTYAETGATGATVCYGFLVNYIDASNYYGCSLCDDATTGVVKVIKVSGGTGSTLSSTTQGTVPTSGTDVLRCSIDYSGSNPAITFKNQTSGLTWVNAVSDSSSPLTKTGGVGILHGATPEATGDDIATGLRFLDFKVTEVSAAVSRHAIVIN